jgi:hypothetical protein
MGRTRSGDSNQVGAESFSMREVETDGQVLRGGGFPLRRLSIIGKGYHSEEKPTGFYTTGDRVKTW